MDLSEFENPDNFKSKHWMHYRTGDDRELIALSGIAIVNFEGLSDETWLSDTLNLGVNIPSALIPADKQFQVQTWTTFMTLNSIYDKDQSVNAGFAVDEFWGPGAITTKGYITLHAKLAVRDSDAILYRVGYEVTMVGNFIPWEANP